MISKIQRSGGGSLLYLLLSLLLLAAPGRGSASAAEFVDSGQALGISHSQGVALGDLDGDGDLDAFVVSDMEEANRVYLNGSGIFTDSGQALGGESSTGVYLGDLDGDGDLDAFIANLGANQVWLNDGASAFTDSGQVIGSEGSRGVALGDLDGDGDLDAFVINGYEQPDRVYFNDSSGGFSDSGQGLGTTHGRSVSLGDLDGDGDLDAYVSALTLYREGNYCDDCYNRRPQPDTVYFNDGSGFFIDSGQRITEYLTTSALGDLDGDGDLDAFVAFFLTEFDSYPHGVFLNSGGTFTDSGQELSITDARSVALGDADGDGDLDALVVNFLNQGHLLFLNDGAGFFADSGQDFGSASGTGASFGDLDGDGDLDVFITLYHGQPDRIYLNEGE